MLSSLVRKKRTSDAKDPEHHGSDQKNKRSKLHEHTYGDASLQFFRQAVHDPKSFVKSTARDGGQQQAFGVASEAFFYNRKCYDELLADIEKTVERKWEEKIGSFLVEIRGSAGIGKSVFLALTMAIELQDGSGMKNFALFHHAPKEGLEEDKAYPIDTSTSEVRCSVWIDGDLKMDGAKYGLEQTQVELDSLLMKKNNLDIIYMDGCSMPIHMNDFGGLILVAASPSVNTRGLRKALPNKHVVFYMPPWSEEEYLAAGKLVGVDDEEILKDNYNYMNGIIRYAFSRNGAKEKVEEAIKEVNPSSIARLVVASNDTNKVHSLVLWIPRKKKDGTDDYYTGDVSYSLVSRIVERKVAKKLLEHEMSELQDARRKLSAISGAEGYAGALFEAYAIKAICNGGEFTVLKNQSDQQGTSLVKINVPRLEEEDPIVLRTNKLDQGSLSFATLLERTETENKMMFKPRLVWPETNNFPTFDAYYLHEDGELFSLQMTIAREGGFLKHTLNNGGAYQTMKYLDALRSETGRGGNNKSVKKYRAVFVVPKPKDRCKPKKQMFTGEVKTSRTAKMDAATAAAMMDQKFEQGIIYL